MKSKTRHSIAIPFALITIIALMFSLCGCANKKDAGQNQANEIAGTYQFVSEDNTAIARMTGLKGGTVTINNDGTFHAEGNFSTAGSSNNVLSTDGTYKIDGDDLTVTESKSQKSFPSPAPPILFVPAG